MNLVTNSCGPITIYQDKIGNDWLGAAIMKISYDATLPANFHNPEYHTYTYYTLFLLQFEFAIHIHSDLNNWIGRIKRCLKKKSV